MWRFAVTACCLFACAMFAAGAVPSTYVEGFDNTNLAAWEAARNTDLQVVREDGESFLRFMGRGLGTVRIPCGNRRDFVFEADIRGPGGMYFRKDYKVFFKPGGDMWYRRPGAMLIRWVREPRDITKFHTVRVTCAGKVVRVTVDGKMELEFLDHDPVAAPLYLRVAADFDNVRVTDAVPRDEALIALPVDAGADFFEEGSYARMKVKGPRVKDTALVFHAGDDVRVPVQLLNANADTIDMHVRGTLATFDGKAVANAQAARARVDAKGRSVADLDYGRVASGFYQLALALSADGKAIRETTYPVFVGVPEKPVAYEPPVFPFGAQLAIITWKPIHTKTYWHAIASEMQKHHMNLAGATGGCHREFLEILQSYGIAATVRSSVRSEYPTVLGLIYNGTQKERIQKSLEASGKPMLYVCHVERIGSGDEDDPLVFWKKHPPTIRLLRINPFRKDDTDWLSGGALLKALGRVDGAEGAPWWAFLQAADDGEENVLRDPTPAEIRAETHLALAYGAKGIIYYTFQGGRREWKGTGRTWRAMVDPISLEPVDNKLETVGELGALVEQHAALLKSLTPAKSEVRSDSPRVVAVCRSAGDDRYVYAVNIDTKSAATCSLTWPDSWAVGEVRDIYSGGVLKATGNAVSLKLDPAEGRLLFLTKATRKP